MELVAERLDNNLTPLSDYETYFREGEAGELRIYLNRPLYQDEIDCLETEILNKGVVLTEPITQDARILVIRFQKAIAPLLIIGGVVTAIVGGIAGWQIFKLTTWGIPLWTILLGGSAILYLLLRKPVKKAAPYAIRAGKSYLTRRIGQ